VATRAAGAISRTKLLVSEPLRIRGTELPDNVLLMAKVTTLAFIATGQFRLLSWHFLPFLRFFDRLGSPAAFHWTLVTAFLAAAAALFYNKHVRVCCFVLGGVILISLLSSRAYFENNRTYCACLLILAGLCNRGQSPWPIRSQVVLVYFGAALNKLLQPDWRSGQFFAYWFGEIHNPHIWARVTAFIPAMPLAQFVCWATIVTELVLVAGFLVPRWYAWSIWLGVAYHTTLLLLMNSTFGMFYYAMLASYLAFVDWPTLPLEVRFDEAKVPWSKARRLLERLRAAGIFAWKPRDSSQKLEAGSRGLLVMDRGKSYWGLAAVKRVLLFTPLTYFSYVILLGRQPHFFQYHRWLAAGVLALFTPYLSALVRVRYWRVRNSQAGVHFRHAHVAQAPSPVTLQPTEPEAPPPEPGDIGPAEDTEVVLHEPPS
jgi:hypothetical protein